MPESDGAVQLAVIWPLPPVPVTPVGAPGKAVQLRARATRAAGPAACHAAARAGTRTAHTGGGPDVPCAVDSPQAVELVVDPAVNVGFEPLTKLVRLEVDTHEDPAPPPLAPSAGRRVQPLPVPLPPPK